MACFNGNSPALGGAGRAYARSLLERSQVYCQLRWALNASLRVDASGPRRPLEGLPPGLSEAERRAAAAHFAANLRRMVFLTRAGTEIGVASTKAFTTQITILTLIALLLAKRKGEISTSKFHAYLQELERIPQKVEKALESNDHVKYVAHQYKDAENALYLGRGYNFPVALEGALKLKEISYIHAEGYPAAEMKHGPIALIDENMPIVVIATKKGHYEKIVSNIQEVKARKGIVIAVVTKGDKVISKIADYTIEIPDTEEPLTPLLSVIPLQLLSYHIALIRGCNVDQPRNLAKSVTVE